MGTKGTVQCAETRLQCKLAQVLCQPLCAPVPRRCCWLDLREATL